VLQFLQLKLRSAREQEAGCLARRFTLPSAHSPAVSRREQERLNQRKTRSNTSISCHSHSKPLQNAIKNCQNAFFKDCSNRTHGVHVVIGARRPRL